jgi:hypothetical protein
VEIGVETFPFPEPTDEQKTAISAAAKELDGLRTGWLNPAEWTREEVLEFPGSADGPWARYIDPVTVQPGGKGSVPFSEDGKLGQTPGGIGTVRACENNLVWYGTPCRNSRHGVSCHTRGDHRWPLRGN